MEYEFKNPKWKPQIRTKEEVEESEIVEANPKKSKKSRKK